jgi:hypothetical protein
MTNQGDDKGRPDANRAEGSQANAGILKKRKPRSLDEEMPLETKPPWSESPSARLSGAKAAVPPLLSPPSPPSQPSPPSPPPAARGAAHLVGRRADASAA